MQSPDRAKLVRPNNRAVFALLSRDSELQTKKRAAIAMSRIYAYLSAARKHVHAVEALERKADPEKVSYSSTMIQAFIHAHLYFICWAAIGRMIDVIRRCSGLEAPNRIWKKHRAELEKYAVARDHFEHYEERLPRGRKSATLVNAGDYGSLHKGLFSLGGYRWDASKESLQKLGTIVAELDASLSREGGEKPKGQKPLKFLSANPA